MFGLGRREIIILAVVIVAVIFGTGYRLAHMQSVLDEETSFVVGVKDGKSGPAAAGGKETAMEEEEKIIVHVTGAVRKPGVYSLPAGSRVIDALNLAVPAADADLEQLNLAVETDDGEQIEVPCKGEAEDGHSTRDPGGSTGKRPDTGGTGRNSVGSAAVKIKPGKININKAGAEELDTLPGIGPALAERILAYREEQGKFKDAAELKNVSGIGDKKFEGLAEFVTVK